MHHPKLSLFIERGLHIDVKGKDNIRTGFYFSHEKRANIVGITACKCIVGFDNVRAHAVAFHVG